ARTVRLLAQVTQQVAIVQYPSMSSATVRHIEVVSLTATRILLILITSTGRVEQRSFEVSAYDEDTLSDLRRHLNTAADGRSTAQAASRLNDLSDQLPLELRPIGQPAVAALLEMLGTEASTRVVVGGVPNLTRFGAEFETTVKPVLEALEEQVVLLKLLGEATTADAVTVRIGQENPFQELRTTSVVSSGYGGTDDPWATLGIVGPTRMDYPSTMASVRAVARYVGRFLAEG
ncbi:MAG TPA: HrcA family transcriptional regulator, partial [Microlunatus sp.]|nr:HrcA family transcriptional regulator [Microlunatus sp.]